MKIEKELAGVQKNILLKDQTTFKIGGPAKYFFVAKNKEDLIKGILMAKELGLPFFILGGGSNLLVSDRGYDGLIIKTQNSRLRQGSGLQAKLKTIYVESGARLSELVKMSLEKSLTGLEWAAGIPGTVGGAIRGNTGAFGKSIASIIKDVEVFDVKIQKIKKFSKKDCKFDYRESIFKRKPNLIILSAVLQLKRENKKKIKEKIKKYLKQKKETQPLNFPSAGSIFKNPKNFPAAELGEENKFSSSAFAAARLIEKCNLKGKKIGKAQISKKHPNFIVNLGDAKAKDVIKLINLIKEKVKSKFGIVLEKEIQYLGF